MGGSVWLLADRGVRIGLAVAVNVVLARVLGPADFGLMAYALALAALFLPFSTLGLERIVVRELAREAGAPGRVLGSVVGVRLIGGVLGAALAVAAALASAGPDRRLVAAMVTLVAAGNLLQAFDVIDWTFQARGDFRRGTLPRLIAFVVAALAKIGLACAGAGLVALSALSAIEMLLSSVLQIVAWRRSGGTGSSWSFEPTLAAGLLRLSAPLLAGEIGVWLFQKADVLILQHFAGEAAVGYYAVAQRVAQLAYFLPVLAVQVFSPRVARVADDAAALAFVQKVMNGLVLAAYAVACGLAVLSGLLVRGLFGAAYVPAAGLLAWLAWSNVFVFMGCAHTLYLVNRDAQKISCGLAWLTAFVSVGLNFLLVPVFAARGAAIASVSAYLLTTVFGVALFAGSRPLLLVNLRALAAPVWVVQAWLRRPRAGVSP